MRIVVALLIASVLALSVSGRAIMATERDPEDPAHMVEAIGEETVAGAEDGDDDTVNVQLVVLGIVGGVVFLLLPLGYMFRRRQGLTAYTPPADGH